MDDPFPYYHFDRGMYYRDGKIIKPLLPGDNCKPGLPLTLREYTIVMDEKRIPRTRCRASTATGAR
jgi:hypothetical protein